MRPENKTVVVEAAIEFMIARSKYVNHLRRPVCETGQVYILDNAWTEANDAYSNLLRVMTETECKALRIGEEVVIAPNRYAHILVRIGDEISRPSFMPRFA